MSKQVVWTEKTLNDFIKLGNLNSEDEFIMRSRCKGMTVIQQSQALHCSESRVAKRISEIKKIYDYTQTQHPDILLPRKSSAKELYMDNN